MTIYLKMEKIAQKISEQCRQIERKNIERFLDAIIDARRIFVAGVGRSGLIARAFGMRLMHLGFTVYVVGEATTPAIKPGDLLVIVSGSGQTQAMITAMNVSRQKGAKVAAITSFLDSPIGKGADCVVQIKGRQAEDAARDYMDRQLSGEYDPITPLGTLFELSAMVFLDAVIDELMERYQKSEEQLKEFHSDLE